LGKWNAFEVLIGTVCGVTFFFLAMFSRVLSQRRETRLAAVSWGRNQLRFVLGLVFGSPGVHVAGRWLPPLQPYGLRWLPGGQTGS